MAKSARKTTAAAVSALVALASPLVVTSIAAPAAAAQEAQGTAALFRLYNPNSGEHFYTEDTQERDTLVTAGWEYEGIGWVAPATGAPVYRVYNPNTGDHHYTTSEDEKDSLTGLGWMDEGVGWFSGGDLPVYRQYNPYAATGLHNFTASAAEDSSLVQAGWSDEGTAWQAVGLPTAEQSQEASDEVDVVVARRDLNGQLKDGQALLDSSYGAVDDGQTRQTLTDALNAGYALINAGSQDANALESAAVGIYSASVAVYSSMDLASARAELVSQLDAAQALLSASDGRVADPQTRFTLTDAINEGNALRSSQDAQAMRNAANAVWLACNAVNSSITAKENEDKTTLWQRPTGGAYPDLSQYSNIWIHVSTGAQRVTIMSGDNVIYTMVTSTGKANTPTKKGTFSISGRGPQFISRGMGGKWWVRITGDYLFHTVPINSRAQYIPSEAAKLGQPASHGCVRLSVPDAKWIYDNIPDGTKVVID